MKLNINQKQDNLIVNLVLQDIHVILTKTLTTDVISLKSVRKVTIALRILTKPLARLEHMELSQVFLLKTTVQNALMDSTVMNRL